MLWDDEGFVALYDARLSAGEAAHVRQAADALNAMQRHVAAGRTLTLVETALYAVRLIAASLTGGVDAAIASFEHACAVRGLDADDDDREVLSSRVAAALRLRRDRVLESVVSHTLPLGLSRPMASTLVDQAFEHAKERLSVYAQDPRRNGPKSVFIGHSAVDRRMAALLKETVAAFVPSEVDVFVSSDLDSIKAGEDWLERIIDRLRNCTVVVALITPNSTESTWVHYEVGLADAGKPVVIPVTARGGHLSELPAPLGRRQGRNLASAEEAVVLLSEIAAEVGVTDRDTAVPSFEELLLEARRPILASRLSVTGLRIAEILSARSENATEWDPSIDAEALVRELGVSPVTFLAAMAELQELGWLLIREGGGGLGVSSIGPAEEFFVDSESALGSGDPVADARRIAQIVARRPHEAGRVAAIAAELGWTPRRMNAALHVVKAAAPDAVVSVEGRGALAYVLVLPEPGLLRLAQPR
jgi:TIR domain-containing protein